MSDTVRIKPLAEPIGGGANVAELRRNSHLRAVTNYRATAGRINPTGWHHAAVQGGLFDGLAEDANAPHRVFSDVV
ncbi:hypothetical protein ACIG3E_11325 [Streptomyces sp. NPDC053474]|uniref:hypothetical protein n=1 Tax=Streptomyces sp. NPDC053474 TaxID=3365704 RepID=UPI0037D82370